MVVDRKLTGVSAAPSSLWSQAACHAQTLTAALPLRLPLPAGVSSEMVELPIPEGGSLVAACTWQPEPAPAVIVLHGVAGSSDDAYVVRAATALAREGFHVLRLNQRGSGRGKGKARRLYHAGLGEDVALAARFLGVRKDVTAVGALGFSLGGHLALCHAADLSAGRDDSPLATVVAVSAPVDLHDTMRSFDALRRGVSGLYERSMMRSLVETARALKKREGDAAPFTLDELRRVKDVRSFDSLVTVRCHGFRDVAEYHARASVAPRLKDIRLPTLIIHAADDPIVPARALERAAPSSHVDVVITPNGGHVGFVEGLGQLWGSTAAVARATAHLAHHLRLRRRRAVAPGRIFAHRP